MVVSKVPIVTQQICNDATRLIPEYGDREGLSLICAEGEQRRGALGGAPQILHR